jgi:hypothetical protein
MLPNAESVAIAMVLILGAIVAWDAWWIARQHRDIPEFGRLPNNGFAWKSERSHEMFRQWANLGSMAAMMALPWGFASFSNTPIVYVVLWDILLGLHIISLLVPKRYAVTSTHLFADYAFQNVNQSTELCYFAKAGGHSDLSRSEVIVQTLMLQHRSLLTSFIQTKRNEERYG